MYLPPFNAETDRTVLHALIRARPLGSWVTQDETGLVANHVPFLLDADRGEHGTLLAHVARANPVWRGLAGGSESLVIFQGAQGYVTPSWYAAKREHGKVVPTWNYAVVHAHGVARAIDDRDRLRTLVARLTDRHEAPRAEPWRLADAPAGYIDGLLGAIVGIEIPITRLTGKWKLSQNRSLADRRGVADGLGAQPDDDAQALAALVRQYADRAAGS